MKTQIISLKLLIIMLVGLNLISPQIAQAKASDLKHPSHVVFKNDLDKLLTNKTLSYALENHSVVKKQKTPSIIANFPKRPASTEKKISKNETPCPSTQNKTIATSTTKETKSTVSTSVKTKPYWDTLYALESSEGKRLYRPSNKSRSCKYTSTPCGHHQLSIIALKDIGCTSLKCRSARADYKKSLAMSQKLAEINEKRLKKFGFANLPDYQKYLVHQQGSAGIGIILKARKGKKTLSKNMLRMMANNSPFSYKRLRNAGSRGAARKFLNFWKEKWQVKNSQRVAGG